MPKKKTRQIFELLTDREDFLWLKPINSFCQLQKLQATKKFPYSCSHYNPITERVKSELVTSSPVNQSVDPSNKYNPMAPRVHHELDMAGPIYHGVESHNQYVPMEQERISGHAEMSGPKYPGIEEQHKYGPVGERVRGELSVNGPVYPVDPHNKYSIVPDRKSGQIVMAGPAYAGVRASNQYNPVKERVPGPHVMAGPVYEGVESSHRCNLVPGKPEGVPQVSGPVYPVNSSHKYSGEMSDIQTDISTPMMGPVFNILHDHHYREVRTFCRIFVSYHFCLKFPISTEIVARYRFLNYK